MKKILFGLVCAWQITACVNSAEADRALVQQQLEQIKQTIAAEPDSSGMVSYVDALPEKFKQENEEAFKKLRKGANDVSSKKAQCLSMLKDAAQKSEQLLQSGSADMKKQLEEQIAPTVKEASDGIVRYNKGLEMLKSKVDSIAALYGSKENQ